LASSSGPAGYSGIVHCDGHVAYEQLVGPKLPNGQITLFVGRIVAGNSSTSLEGGSAPIANEVLERIAELYAIESRMRGQSAEQRRAARQAESKPLVESLERWLETQLAAVSQKSVIADSDDGRIELDTNPCRARQPPDRDDEEE
jgi:hypothetical protein